ncbi:MAG: adenine phosphoribosyltransferase [Actinomycetales bacterium]|nr:adenine phosphoribosyltransferase [Actinomycetales bacterium]
MFDRSAVERQLWSRVHDVPDWPEPGVLFRDLTPLMADGDAFGAAVDLMAVQLGRGRVDVIVGIEARGFPFAAALAYHLGAGFVTLRKPGKLPRDVHSESYDLEYGSTALEVHRDAMAPGTRAVIVDDVLATGGTACAAVELVRRTGAELVSVAVIMDLPTLGGADRVRALGVPVSALLNGDAPVH